MLEKLRNIFAVPELKRRIFFTLGMFAVYRLGEHMPSPGVNAQALAGAFESQRGTLFGLYDFFVGGAFSRATIFALGIMPYISSSIILQLLGAVCRTREAAQGRRGGAEEDHPAHPLRHGADLHHPVFAYSVFLVNMGASQGLTVVPHPGRCSGSRPSSPRPRAPSS
jgi:preprotein translocase subunit SecY